MDKKISLVRDALASSVKDGVLCHDIAKSVLEALEAHYVLTPKTNKSVEALQDSCAEFIFSALDFTIDDLSLMSSEDWVVSSEDDGCVSYEKSITVDDLIGKSNAQRVLLRVTFSPRTHSVDYTSTFFPDGSVCGYVPVDMLDDINARYEDKILSLLENK